MWYILLLPAQWARAYKTFWRFKLQKTGRLSLDFFIIYWSHFLLKIRIQIPSVGWQNPRPKIIGSTTQTPIGIITEKLKHGVCVNICRVHVCTIIDSFVCLLFCVFILVSFSATEICFVVSVQLLLYCILNFTIF